MPERHRRHGLIHVLVVDEAAASPCKQTQHRERKQTRNSFNPLAILRRHKPVTKSMWLSSRKPPWCPLMTQSTATRQTVAPIQAGVEEIAEHHLAGRHADHGINTTSIPSSNRPKPQCFVDSAGHGSPQSRSIPPSNVINSSNISAETWRSLEFQIISPPWRTTGDVLHPTAGTMCLQGFVSGNVVFA